MRWIVMCRVSGGVTGTRQAPLKGRDGDVRDFETREAAADEARRLNREMNGPYGAARFTYWPEEVHA